MLKKLVCFIFTMCMLFTCIGAGAESGTFDGAKIFCIETLEKPDIFGAEGDTITYNNYVEYDGTNGGEVCAGAYVYNDSLTNGDCVEMKIMLIEYSGSNPGALKAIHLKHVHACAGDNGKLVYTDPVAVDPAHTLKAMIWGEATVIPYGKSTEFKN